MTNKKYPCEKCELKKAIARGMDLHWFDNEDCPFECPFVNESEVDTE